MLSASIDALDDPMSMAHDLQRRAGLGLLSLMASAAALLPGAGAAFAQESPADVTPAQVAIFQIGLEAGCKRSGRRRGEAPEHVDAFCNCTLKVLKENASFAEWQQAVFQSRKRLSREESSALLAPHAPKLDVCKAEARQP